MLYNVSIVLLQPTKTGSNSAVSYLKQLNSHRPLHKFDKKELEDKILICTVRNPYDRFLSMLNHFAPNVDDIKENVLKECKYFPQMYHLKYEDIEADHIIRVENQEEELKKVVELYNLETREYKPINVRVKDRDGLYIKYPKLKEEDYQMVNELYKEDFEYLGYKMI